MKIRPDSSPNYLKFRITEASRLRQSCQIEIFDKFLVSNWNFKFNKEVTEFSEILPYFYETVTE